MGLVAGVFFAYANSIMPGLRNTDDRTFVGAFQALDRAIINPIFTACFFGALVLTGPGAGLQIDVDNHSVLPWAPVAFVLYLAAVIITLAVNVPLNDAIKAAGNPDGVDDLDTARCPDLENPVVVGTAWTAMSARRSRRPEGMSWRVGAAPQAQAQQAAGEKRESSEQGGESGHDGRADPVGLCRGTADIGDGGNRACAGTVGCRGLCRDGDAVLGVRLARSVRCQSRPQGCGTWRSGRPGTGQRGRCRARRLAGSRAARGRLGTWRGRRRSRRRCWRWAWFRRRRRRRRGG
jgi:uncharacterized membrane protein